jgi:seryl-tRNA synthetase
MYDLSFVRENVEALIAKIGTRGEVLNLDEFIQSDGERRRLLVEVESGKHELNVRSKEIGALRKQGQDASEAQAEMRALSESIKENDKRLKQCEAVLQRIIERIPNLPHGSVPLGLDEKDNPVERVVGRKPLMDFPPLAHDDLGAALGILDFKRAVRMTGSRFCLLRGAGAKMERALASLMLDMQTGEHGYLEVMPPYIVNAGSLFATGQLPKFAADLFKLEKLEGQDYYLIPTAEVPVTNIHAGERLDGADLPLRYTAYTPCFRSEAGAWGKDTKGLIRQHQFNKVELVCFSHPDESYTELERLTGHAEAVLQRLGLHYRVVSLCTGDLGFSAAKTYDLEVWVPSQNAYREISSCSNFEDFQARRAGIRFKPRGGGKAEYVHTLNGSALALGRTMVALLEQYQQADGSVRIPEALQPYMDGLELLTP